MKDQRISSAEWEVMRVVWAYGAVKSRQVIDVLAQEMDWKAATIKTLLGRLVDKGVLSSHREGRCYIYRANISEERMVEHLGDQLLASICARDVGDLLHYLIKTHPLSRADIKKIQKTLQEKQQTAPETLACHCVKGQCDCNL